MDDGSETQLNDTHPAVEFAFEKPRIIYENEEKLQILKILDVK